jgi:hypothetical protein
VPGRCGSARERSCAALPNVEQKVHCAASAPENSVRDTHARRARSLVALALQALRDAVRHGCAAVARLAERLPLPGPDRRARPDQRSSDSPRTAAEAPGFRRKVVPLALPIPQMAVVALVARRAACRDAVVARYQKPEEAAELLGLPKAEPLVLPRRR